MHVDCDQPEAHRSACSRRLARFGAALHLRPQALVKRARFVQRILDASICGSLPAFHLPRPFRPGRRITRARGNPEPVRLTPLYIAVYSFNKPSPASPSPLSRGERRVRENLARDPRLRACCSVLVLQILYYMATTPSSTTPSTCQKLQSHKLRREPTSTRDVADKRRQRHVYVNCVPMMRTQPSRPSDPAPGLAGLARPRCTRAALPRASAGPVDEMTETVSDGREVVVTHNSPSSHVGMPSPPRVPGFGGLPLLSSQLLQSTSTTHDKGTEASPDAELCGVSLTTRRGRAPKPWHHPGGYGAAEDETGM